MYKKLDLIPEDSTIENPIENNKYDILESQIKECPICLSSDEPFINTGCDICKGNNQIIHKECLENLKRGNYHITQCYICKNRLKSSMINRIECKRKLINFFKSFLFYSLCGFFLKILFIFIIYNGISQLDYIIFGILNPFQNIVNFCVQLFFTLIAFSIGVN